MYEFNHLFLAFFMGWFASWFLWRPIVEICTRARKRIRSITVTISNNKVSINEHKH